MTLTAVDTKVYHVFLASPGDVVAERQHVRDFFDRYNRHTAQLWNARFEVVDWENYATIGVGRPQELITKQTLERFRSSLALVIGIMGQRFGSPTGKAESGTEEEFGWALDSHLRDGYPEIKWFFRRVDSLVLPPKPEEAALALDQWTRVVAFRERLQTSDPPVFFAEYANAAAFRDTFDDDLQLWLADAARPWVAHGQSAAVARTAPTPVTIPTKYYDNLIRDFHRLDIAGIDNDRTFDIPLSDIYVRLRVMFDDEVSNDAQELADSGPIDIQTALLRYPKLVIVGDPGSGKSTFLKYIALMLARSMISGNAAIALEKLCLADPLPIPIFLSCWDLADFLKKREVVRLDTLIAFIVERLAAYELAIDAAHVERLLDAGVFCLLFDGLDEVPTDHGRAAVSRMLEECVTRFDKNRYVVTSRVRAYTGDAILRGGFTRCDIQPFDASDREQFVRNWVSLLFRVPPEAVSAEGRDAKREYDSLVAGIEDNDRIRPLAVNPLLLTVIAIVHWNRKRLPQQRVDLYDECVDVLLGQRKEAEHIQLSRKATALDERSEQQQHEERSWVRKRFAEIALHILSQDGDRDEVTKADLIVLLTPRFIDQGAATTEQAAARADLFLDRQELRSGLLVSRRAQSYRFVHLTFQEYLAAWQLSNLEFDRVTERIQPRLRSAKWFESLQLLGGEWAKQSDEKLDRYVAWLLEQQGTTIAQRAPVIALCANIVKDIAGVSELKPQTRQTFRAGLEATLDAFRKGSGVSPKTQLEILEALGQLGGAVKKHLIDATKASLFQVRRRAIEMLLPHLSEDELFSMGHILNDGSREPIRTYIWALLVSNPSRFEKWIDATTSFNGKLSEAMMSLVVHFRTLELDALVLKIASKCSGSDVFTWGLQTEVVRRWPDETTRQLLMARIVNSSQPVERIFAMDNLVTGWRDEITRQFLIARATAEKDHYIRALAVQKLASEWPDDITNEFLRSVAAGPDTTLRPIAFGQLAGAHSPFGATLATRKLDGRGPYLDPTEPVPHHHIRGAAERTSLPANEIDAAVASLSAHVGWDITRGSQAKT